MPSKTALLLYRLIVNKTTRVADALGISMSEMSPEDIEWLYNAIGEDWNTKQDAVEKINNAVKKWMIYIPEHALRIVAFEDADGNPVDPP